MPQRGIGITGEHTLTYRVEKIASFGEGICGGSVKDRDSLGQCRPQASAQELVEQIVIAIPVAFAIEPDDEQVRGADLVEQRGTIGAARHRVAERCVERLELAADGKELLYLRCLKLDHLVHEVVDEVSVSVDESTEHAVGIGDVSE